MDWLSVPVRSRNLVEILPSLLVVLDGFFEMNGIVVLPQLWQEGFQCRVRVSDIRVVHFGATPQLLAANINLHDFGVFWEKLLIREVRADHQQDVAVHHSVIAGRESQKTSHADVKRVVVLDKLLSAHGVHNRGVQLSGQGNQFSMRSGTAGTAKNSDFLRLIENFG